MGAVLGKSRRAMIWKEGKGKERCGMVELGKPEPRISQDGR